MPRTGTPITDASQSSHLAPKTQPPSNLRPLALGSSGPRPLQLATGALQEVKVLSPPLTSGASSSSAPTSRPGLSRSTSLSGGRFIGPKTTGTPVQDQNGLPRRSQKRMSSICYSSSKEAFFIGRPGTTSAPQSPALSQRPNSATGLGTSVRGEEDQAWKRVSTVSSTDASEDDPSNGSRATVLTLAEKHADLLRFIASKESKCLELRTQLEQHESELILLKKKWERIVSKAKPEGVDLSAGRDGGGEAVRAALKEVGRLLGGGLGIVEEAPSSGSMLMKKAATAPLSASPSPNPAGPFPTPSAGAATPRSSKDASRPITLPTRETPRRQIPPQSPSLSSSSISSPRSTAVDTSGSSSARDSLSSIASSIGDMTPTEPAGHASSMPLSLSPLSPTSPPPTAALDDLARASKPWIPLPAGLNKWTPTLEKHSKRASLLVSDVTDMSTSILGSLSNALLSSGGASSAPSMALAARVGQRRRSPDTRTSNAQTVFEQRLLQASLLDEADDLAALVLPIKPQTSPSLSPSTSMATIKSPKTTTVTRTLSLTKRQSKKAADTDEEEWNW